MSEDATSRSEQAAMDGVVVGNAFDFGGANQPPTAEVLLREARQAQRLAIDRLAALLKISVKKLQALEQGGFELPRDSVFSRTLPARVCRILKIDAAPVLLRLPVISAFKVTFQNRAINTAFLADADGHGRTAWLHFSRSAVLMGLALLFGAIALISLPVVQQEIARDRHAESGVEQKLELVKSAFMTRSAAMALVSNGTTPELTRNSPHEVLPPVTVEPSLAVSNSDNRNVKDMIAFSATSESWLKVADAKGAIVPGHTLQTDGSAGQPSLVVVVKRAHVI